MRVPILSPEVPLAELRREVRYTLAVLRQRPWAAPHVPAFEGLLKEVGAAQVEQATLLDKAEDAAAAADEVDLHLDTLVETTAGAARKAVDKDTRAPLWRALFGAWRPSELVRPKLGEELAQVRTWPELLKAAPTAELRDLAAPCEKLVKAADEALRAQEAAGTALQVFRSSKLVALLAKLNSERSGLAGEAERQAFDGKIRPEAAAGIFRLATRRRPRPETLESVQAELHAAEQEQARLQQRLTELKAAQLAQQQAAAQRQADEEALRTLRAAQAAGAQQIAELEKRLSA